MRKLNKSYLKNYGKAAGAASLAFLYEEIAGAAVVKATAQDNKISPFDVGMQLFVGWGPIALAAHQMATRPGGSYFWSSFGGAMMFNRIDNLGVALGMPALTPFGAVMPGETLAQAQIRLNQ